MTLYSARTQKFGFLVSKLSDFLEYEDSYSLTKYKGSFRCNCIAAKHGPCKHVDILQKFIDANLVNTGSFYNFESKKFEPPVQQE